MTDLPLSGIRVLDFTHEWAATIGPRVLGDFGAQVIKVEYARRMCVLRGARLEEQMYNRHPRWHQVNRNKLSVTLDLHNDEEMQAFRDLVKISDIVISNSRPVVLERFGLSYPNLKQLKSDIILVLMSAYGATGPYSTFPGFGATIEALSGLQGLTAYERGGKKYRVKEMDVVNGFMGICAIMTALLHLQQTGEGMFVDLSQMEAATHGLMGEHLLEYAMNYNQSLPTGNRHTWFAPQGCYRCRGDDNWVTITVTSESEWHSLCELLGHDEWGKDPRFSTRNLRRKNHDDLDKLLEEWFLNHGHYEAMHLLQQAGVPAGAVLNGHDLLHDPHLRERNYFTGTQDGTPGLYPGMLAALSAGEGKLFRRGPDLGQHNEYVLCELLGWPKDKVKPLKEDDIRTGYEPE